MPAKQPATSRRAANDLLLGQEQWLRENGLPLVVTPMRRLRGIVPRTVPLLITFALLAIGLLVADSALSAVAPSDIVSIEQAQALLPPFIVAAFILLAAIPIGLGYARLQRLMKPRQRLWTGSVVILFWLFGLSGIAALGHANSGLHLDWLSRLILLLAASLIGYYGLGNMLSWASKRGARELAITVPAIIRLLPLLLLTVLLVFFTNELWQLAGTMSRTRMWMLAGFLILMIVLVLLPATLDMVDDEDDADLEEDLSATPFAGLTATKTSISIGERFNLLAVSLAVQTVQVAIFVLATFAVFAVFGSISVSPALIETWTGEPARPLTVFGLRLPLEQHIFRVCSILALFSGISFAASMLQDERYRSLFLDPVAREVKRNLAARHRYRESLKELSSTNSLGLADD